MTRSTNESTLGSSSEEGAPPGPSRRDWALLVTCAVFVAMGIFILPSKLDVGIVTIVLFGLAGLAPITTIVRKRRNRRERPLRAAIVGGVRIGASRSRLVMLSLALVLLGGTLVWFGGSYPATFRVLAWFVAVVGLLLCIAVAARWLPVGHLMFTPQGLTMGHRGYTVFIRWDDMLALDGIELHDNPALRLWLRPGANITVEPPAFRRRALSAMATNEGWLGAPIVIMTGTYALDLPPLQKAFERYILDPASRAELDSSRLLQPPVRE